MIAECRDKRGWKGSTMPFALGLLDLIDPLPQTSFGNRN